MSNERVRGGIVFKQSKILPVSKIKKDYVVIWIEDITGKIEEPILLTVREYSKLPSLKSPVFDKLVLSRCYPVGLYGTASNFVKVSFNKVESVLIISNKRLEAYKERARKNPQMVPKKKWIDDLRD